ncbi:hypothetical protein [Methylacidiphilum sp. Yel]|uniref:hypothetical protein n=1 Tax=Methylacidiphilum sp. Yel TaxID=1847730 RepID=UPI001ABD40A8|nr:hypothetical protein [Methylacidiphilum sp. Yel]
MSQSCKAVIFCFYFQSNLSKVMLHYSCAHKNGQLKPQQFKIHYGKSSSGFGCQRTAKIQLRGSYQLILMFSLTCIPSLFIQKPRIPSSVLRSFDQSITLIPLPAAFRRKHRRQLTHPFVSMPMCSLSPRRSYSRSQLLQKASLRTRTIATFSLVLFFLTGTLLSAPQNPSCQEREEDGIAIQQQAINHVLLPSFLLEKSSKPPQEPSGNWFLSLGTGTAFPEFDRGEIVNNLNGMVMPIKYNADFAFTSLLSIGFRWFDSQRFGHWSFDVGFLGAYLGTGTSALSQRDQNNLGFLGPGGSIGYRFGQDRFEPFIGFAGGAAIVNVESTSVNLGNIWGYWFAPRSGIRYYFPGTPWSIGIEGIFRFVGALNGFEGPSAGFTFNKTPHAGLEGHWLYVLLVLFEIGYRF